MKVYFWTMLLNANDPAKSDEHHLYNPMIFRKLFFIKWQQNVSYVGYYIFYKQLL